MHINYFALNDCVDELVNFLKETPIEFHVEVEGLSSSDIK